MLCHSLEPYHNKAETDGKSIHLASRGSTCPWRSRRKVHGLTRVSQRFLKNSFAHATYRSKTRLEANFEREAVCWSRWPDGPPASGRRVQKLRDRRQERVRL